MAAEPKALVRGKEFHKRIQKEWEAEAQGDVRRERQVIKQNGRKGRVDIFVNDTEPDAPIAIVEIKATDWDHIKKENIDRNIKRQIRQIWNYIETQILDGQYTKDGEHKEVCPGVIFPRAPKDEGLKQKIEGEFEAYGIAVVWHEDQ